jgi:hypothetical protein
MSTKISGPLILKKMKNVPNTALTVKIVGRLIFSEKWTDSIVVFYDLIVHSNLGGWVDPYIWRSIILETIDIKLYIVSTHTPIQKWEAAPSVIMAHGFDRYVGYTLL